MLAYSLISLLLFAMLFIIIPLLWSMIPKLIENNAKLFGKSSMWWNLSDDKAASVNLIFSLPQFIIGITFIDLLLPLNLFNEPILHNQLLMLSGVIFLFLVLFGFVISTTIKNFSNKSLIDFFSMIIISAISLCIGLLIYFTNSVIDTNFTPLISSSLSQFSIFIIVFILTCITIHLSWLSRLGIGLLCAVIFISFLSAYV